MSLKIYCDEYNFSALEGALCGEVEADCPLALEIVMQDREGIQSLNARFRGKDSPTDVLSFPTLNLTAGAKILSDKYPYDKDESGALFLGSIVICIEVAKSQAEEYGHSFERELNYLAVHGVCHLLGYDHIEEEDRRAMRAREEKILKKLGLTRD